METLKVLIIGSNTNAKINLSHNVKNLAVRSPFNDKKVDFEIADTETLEEAIKLLTVYSFNVAVIEVDAQWIQTIELLKHINLNLPELYVIIIIPPQLPGLAEEAIRYGVYDFITKPVNNEKLKCIIENIVRQHTYRQLTNKSTGNDRPASAQFLTILSHELKSHINAIEGYLTLAKEKKIIDTKDDYPEMVIRSLDRVHLMRNLVSDILDIIRIESGIKQRNIRSINVHAIAKQCIDLIQPLCNQNDISIFLNCKENITLNADKHELEIVFNNLLSNALKYNKKGGRIEVNIIAGHNRTMISVADSGMGMQRGDIGKIFQDFFRIKTEQTSNISGTGLGLAIVKRIAKLYNAQITVESEPEKGSVFSIAFPKKIN